jgi:hypothetical protein
MSSIRISQKHGVNPSLTKCFYCQGDHSIALLGWLPGDAEAPRECGVVDMSPCRQCEDYMKKGIILIEVRSEEDMNEVERERQTWLQDNKRRPFIPNPYRSGGWWVLTDSAISRMVRPPELRDQILKCRWMFILKETATELGLPDTVTATAQ